MRFRFTKVLRTLVLPGLYIACSLVNVAMAEPVGESDSGSTETVVGAAEHGEHEGQAHKNAVGVFIGLTHEGRRENDFALGLEYVRRLNESFSIGGTLEYTFGDSDFLVAVVPASYYYKQWKLSIAPGVEDSNEGTEALLRFGLGYIFELERGWEVNPQVNVDLVDDEEVWVLGVAFGRAF